MKKFQLFAFMAAMCCLAAIGMSMAQQHDAPAVEEKAPPFITAFLENPPPPFRSIANLSDFKFDGVSVRPMVWQNFSDDSSDVSLLTEVSSSAGGSVYFTFCHARNLPAPPPGAIFERFYRQISDPLCVASHSCDEGQLKNFAMEYLSSDGVCAKDRLSAMNYQMRYVDVRIFSFVNEAALGDPQRGGLIKFEVLADADDKVLSLRETNFISVD